MTRKPRIGVTTNFKHEEVYCGVPRIDLATNYTDAVAAAGGVPMPLVDHGADSAASYIEMIDGLLLTGGPDIDPARYGAEPHLKCKLVHPRRENFEAELTRLAIERGVPILGICLGHQTINVALGGTLIQHLPDSVPGYPLEHAGDGKNPMPRHSVALDPASRLAAVLGTHAVEVTTSHHQAVDRVGRDLRVVAHAPDGVIEAMESADGDQVVVVQWHPEFLAAESDVHRRLFEDLVERAQRRAQA